MASLPVVPGHEGSARIPYMLGHRPRGQSQPMPLVEPESAIERDQRIGLVRKVIDFHLMHICDFSTCAAYQKPLDTLTGRHLMQHRIREFLKVRTSYDVLPLSFRLIIFDTALLVKKSLTILIQNGKMPPAAQNVAPSVAPECTE